MQAGRAAPAGLSDPEARRRLQCLRRLAQGEEGERPRGRARGAPTELVNNHIHTTYSFSPYSPAAAVWLSAQAGLETAGIMDHDTLAGAREFIEAGRITGLATTIGVECRADFANTPLAGRRINNPDQLSNGYVAVHGIPHPMIDTVQEYFAPYRQARERRNRLMVENLNRQLAGLDLGLDYEADVAPLSLRREGGSVTERHILFALAGKLEQKAGRGEALVDFLERSLHLSPGGRIRSWLSDPANPHYRYDLLAALKSELVQRFYLEAREECPRVSELVAFARRVGAIPAYAYLGDVGESVTGDKKSRSFEDGYLQLLFRTIGALGFQAVTYMPSRNTPAQLERVRCLCERHGLFQVSGEDINSPRQSFVCEQLRRPEFRHLVDATWALIGHERAASRDIGRGMFAPAVVQGEPALDRRIETFRRAGVEGQ